MDFYKIFISTDVLMLQKFVNFIVNIYANNEHSGQ